jgi:uncharacterized coiled-coil DUF342 family protein
MFNFTKHEETNEYGKKVEELELQFKKLGTEFSNLVGDLIKDNDLMSSIGGTDDGSAHAACHFMNLMGITNDFAKKQFEALKEEAKAIETINKKLDSLDNKLDELSKKLDSIKE